MQKDLRTFIIAYPDNPVGNIFFNTFRKYRIPITGVVVEQKKGKSNWIRFKKKISKDGLFKAIGRFLHVLWLKYSSQNIVKLANKNKVPIYQVNKFNSSECSELLASLDVDLLVIASAPILKDYIFNKAKKGCLNAHPGWLPTYRGIGANAYALMNGDYPGITIHFIDTGIDTGNIIVREKIEPQVNDTIAKINDRAVERGAILMAEVIIQIQNDSLVIPNIHEPSGQLYKAMPYTLAKEVNKNLKSNNWNRNIKYAEVT